MKLRESSASPLILASRSILARLVFCCVLLAGGLAAQESAPNSPEDRTETQEPSSGIQPSVPYPPYPNYPESKRPRPPRTPRQQEYLYLNHLYFEPLTFALGAFISFGWLGMIGSGVALRLGLDMYNPGTNLSLIISGQVTNPNVMVTGLLLRSGLHFFAEKTQLKGLAVGLELRSGLAVLPASGNRVVIQAALEIPFFYRLVVSFYSQTGRPALSLGVAPYLTLNIGIYLPTAGTVANLRNSDPGFSAYVRNGDFFFEPNFINDIGPLGLKFSMRFGFDVSLVL